MTVAEPSRVFMMCQALPHITSIVISILTSIFNTWNSDKVKLLNVCVFIQAVVEELGCIAGSLA